MDDESDDSGTPGGNSPLSLVLNSGQQYTTEEARKFARDIYGHYLTTRDQTMDSEDKYMDQSEQAAHQAQQVLRQAHDRLAAKKYNKAKMLLAISAGFGAPLRSGAFSESVGNAAALAGPEITAHEKWEDDRSKQMDDLSLESSKMDETLAGLRAKSAVQRRQDEQKLALEALKVVGKEVRPTTGTGPKPLSPFGKQALDEGYDLGTPAFHNRVNELYNIHMRQQRQAAGVDVEVTPPAVKNKLVDDAGIPLDERDPYEGLSTKDRQRTQEARQTEGQTYLKSVQTAIDSAKATKQDMDRWMYLNKKVPTGPVSGRANPSVWMSDAGQELAAIEARQSRQGRVPGEGPMSNYDARQLALASVSRTKRDVPNSNIANAKKLLADQQIQFGQFANDYVIAKGHMVGLEQAWQKYVNDNPIFDPKAPDGSFRRNPARQDYKTYFRSHNAKIGQPKAGDNPTGGYADGGEVSTDDKPKKRVTGLDRLLRNAAQGATFNFSDEMLAGVSPKDYETAVADERKTLEDSSGESPVLSLGEQALGSAATVLPSLYAAKKLNLKGKAGKAAALARVPKNAYARMALMGGAEGALAGWGANQDPESLGLDLVGGAGAGAAISPLAALGTKLGIRGVQRAKDFVLGHGMKAGDRKVIDAAIADNINLNDSAAQLAHDNRAGIPSTLADTGGRNMKGLQVDMAKRTGEGPDEMLDILEGRNQGANERTVERVKSLSPDTYSTKLDALKDQLYSNAKPLYQQAYAANPAIKSQAIFNIMDTDPGKRAVKRALELAQTEAVSEGVPLRQIVGKMKRDPTSGESAVIEPSLRFMDLTKRALDGMINTEERTGATDIGHGLRGLRKTLMAELEDPQVVKGDLYKKARSQYAGDLEVLDALKLGKENFHRMSPNEFDMVTQNMSDAEKSAMKTGVAESLFTKLANTPDATNPSKGLVGTPGMRDKLRKLFPDDASYNEFEGALIKEAQMFDHGKRVVGAGATARAAGNDAAPSTARDLAASAALSAMGNPESMIQPNMWARAGSTLSRAFNPMTQQTIDDTSRLLTTQDPRMAARPLDQLQIALERLKKQYGRASRGALRAGAVAGASVGPDPYGYSLSDEDGANGGYADGGPIVGMSDPRLTPLASPAASTGTRTRATGTPIDYEHYGEGPEFSFFNNNVAPNPSFTPEKVGAGAAGTGAGPASTGNGGSAIGTALGIAANIPKLTKAYDSITGRNAVGDIKSLLGFGSTPMAGVGTGPLMGGLDAIAAQSPLGSLTLAGTLGEGTGAAALGSNAALDAIAAQSPLGQLTLGSLAAPEATTAASAAGTGAAAGTGGLGLGAGLGVMGGALGLAAILSNNDGTDYYGGSKGDYDERARDLGYTDYTQQRKAFDDAYAKYQTAHPGKDLTWAQPGDLDLVTPNGDSYLTDQAALDKQREDLTNAYYKAWGYGGNARGGRISARQAYLRQRGVR